MTQRHIMDSASRRKKVYIDLHKKLREEVMPKWHRSYTSSPDKTARKRSKSAEYRAHGE